MGSVDELYGHKLAGYINTFLDDPVPDLWEERKYKPIAEHQGGDSEGEEKEEKEEEAWTGSPNPVFSPHRGRAEKGGPSIHFKRNIGLPQGSVVPPDWTVQNLMVAIFLYYFEEAIYLMNIATKSKIAKHVVRVAKGNSGGWILRVPKDGGDLSTIRPRCPELCKRDGEGGLVDPWEGTATTSHVSMINGIWIFKGAKTRQRTSMF